MWVEAPASKVKLLLQQFEKVPPPPVPFFDVYQDGRRAVGVCDGLESPRQWPFDGLVILVTKGSVACAQGSLWLFPRGVLGEFLWECLGFQRDFGSVAAGNNSSELEMGYTCEFNSVKRDDWGMRLRQHLGRDGKMLKPLENTWTYSQRSIERMQIA